ncbi:GPI ethanolamine phosphate transferase 3 [Dirofilaria immitis]|nr:GPI ethanolamine phosphate transferase 3 [Dirofilaria immitis]
MKFYRHYSAASVINTLSNALFKINKLRAIGVEDRHGNFPPNSRVLKYKTFGVIRASDASLELMEQQRSFEDAAKRQLLEAHMRGETEQGPSGSFSKLIQRSIAEGHLRINQSQSRNIEIYSLLTDITCFLNWKISMKLKNSSQISKNIRKFVRARTERRLAAESNDYINIVCDEKKLPDVFLPIYNQILQKRKKSLQCYYMIINTLHHYFMRTTWSDLVPDSVNEFIEKHIILTCDDLTTKYDREERAVDIFERLREYELMVLLELHLIKKNPEKIEETEVVNKLGFLVFVADSLYMKNFLDEVICDQFAHIIPKAIVYIYEELCIKMPLDLDDRSADTSASRVLETREAGRRSSRKTGPGSAAMLALERKAVAKKTEKEEKHKKHKNDESSPEPGFGKSKIGLRARAKQAERISKRIAAREKAKELVKEEKIGESGDSSLDTISEGDDLGEIVVPSTPKSKMKKKMSEKASKDDENVMQTPLSKLNRIPTRKNEKLAVLLEKSLKTRSQQQQSRKRNSLPIVRAKMQPRKSRSSLPSSLSASNFTSVSRTRSARINLNERFATMDRSNEETNVYAATVLSATSMIKDISLDKSIIERYRKRIETVRHSACKSDKNEVFYGRCTSRRNLFDDSIDEEDSEGVATHAAACIQKNRSGRSVQTSQKVYMAHALLNVYNKDPLNPPKLPKDAPFKLHRLIRPASKSDKKRLFKLRLRIAREKSGSSSSLVKSNTSCEVPEVASSSRDIKISNESEKLEDVDRKEVPEDPNVGKLSRKLGGIPRNTEADSRCSITSEKSAKIEAVVDVSETMANPCINSDSVSEKFGSADVLEEQIRTTNQKIDVNKMEKRMENKEFHSLFAWQALFDCSIGVLSWWTLKSRKPEWNEIEMANESLLLWLLNITLGWDCFSNKIELDSFRPCVLYEWLRLLMRRSAAKQSNERRLLRPRLEVKEEVIDEIIMIIIIIIITVTTTTITIAINIIMSHYMSSVRRNVEKNWKRIETTWKSRLDIETLPSTRDFVRFLSLDYSDGWNLKLLNSDVSLKSRSYTKGITAFSCTSISTSSEIAMVNFEQMNGKIAHLTNIMFIGISFFISLLLFQHGFLLKRIELTSRSSCSDVASHDACWFPAQYQRVVVVLIDALRYDFAAPSQIHLNSSSKAYLGHFSTISRLLNDHRESAVLMHFHADAPTTTMQRLKALTTGSLPTFIDIGSNFASTAILEDNWIDEIISTNRSIVMLGDDTWVSLYPKQFIRKYHLPSFDITDLHTVDQMILNNLYNELTKSDWTVLIAHFLGVDHCGHKYDDSTLLLVMGDHGMTNNGDHGGDGPLETDAALFMFAKKKLIFAKPPESISQVDIVPTISLLLDSPIPYSNIGTLIDCTIKPEHRALAISSNIEQMMRYGRTMVAETQLPELDSLIRNFENNGNLANSIDYMRHLQKLLRASWTEFNNNFMRIDEEHYVAILDFLLSLSLIVRLVGTAKTLFSFTSTSWEIIVFCMIVAHASSFLSNSYIVFESSVIRFLTQTLIAVTFWKSYSHRKHNNRHRSKSFLTVLENRFGWQRCFIFITIILLLRLSIFFVKCREEQEDACEATVFSQAFSHIPHSPIKIVRFMLGISVQIVAAYMATRFLQNYPSEIWTSILIFPTTIATIASWLSLWLPEDTVSHFSRFSLGSAQIVYGLSFINLAIICFRAARIGKFWNRNSCTISYLMCISSVLFLILGDGLAFSFLSLIIIIFLIPFIIDDEYYQMVFIVLLSSHGFFALSHQPTFSSIPWQAAFVGVPGNFAIQIVPGALVIAHIFASQIITSAALPMLVARQNYRQSGLSYWTYKLILFHSLKALSACAMAAIHRRHLMVWKIFAPKFIFESFSLCVVCLTLLITNCIFWKLIVPPSSD